MAGFDAMIGCWDAKRACWLIVEAAGLSRMYAGLHYRFDCEDGQALGRQVAELMLANAPARHQPIRLD
jgi:hypothetical protein